MKALRAAIESQLRSRRLMAVPGKIVASRSDPKGIWADVEFPNGDHVIVDMSRDGWVTLSRTRAKGQGGRNNDPLVTLDAGPLSRRWDLWRLSVFDRAVELVANVTRVVLPAHDADEVLVKLRQADMRDALDTRGQSITTATEGMTSLIRTYPDKATALKDLREGQAALVARGVDLVAVMQAIEDHFVGDGVSSRDNGDDSEEGGELPVYFGIGYVRSEQNRVVVDEIDADSPAAEGGLQVGDTITAVDTDPVEGIDSLDSLLSLRAPGDVVAITVARSLSLSVKLGKPIDD